MRISFRGRRNLNVIAGCLTVVAPASAMYIHVVPIYATVSFSLSLFLCVYYRLDSMAMIKILGHFIIIRLVLILQIKLKCLYYV